MYRYFRIDISTVCVLFILGNKTDVEGNSNQKHIHFGILNPFPSPVPFSPRKVCETYAVCFLSITFQRITYLNIYI